MSVNIVLPDLPHYVENGISAIYSAKTAEEFNEAFDLFVAEKVTIRVNGEHMSRDEYKKLVMGEIQNDTSADVTFNSVLSVPSKSKDLRAIGTGTVGISFKAVVFGRLFVLGQRESSTVTSSFHATVIQDPSIHHHQVGRGGAFDARRVTIIDEVLTDEQNRITVPGNMPPTTA